MAANISVSICAALPSIETHLDPAGPHRVVQAVDSKGTVYVAVDDKDNSRVVALSVDSTSQTVLPFTGLVGPSVAVDSQGTVYVTDQGTTGC